MVTRTGIEWRTVPGAVRELLMRSTVRGYRIAVEEVPPAEAHQYGIVGVGADHGATFEITKMVEKPKQGTAALQSHNFGAVHILQPEIFKILERMEKGAGGKSN